MAGYHLFSTGEVLSAANVNDYLMKQTVMIFASASARTTALSGVVREGMISYRTDSHITEYYNGSAWVTLGSTLTTKGDIQVYDTAPNRLSTTPSTSTTPLTVTSSTQGYALVQDQAPAVGLNYTPFQVAGKNKIINGDFWWNQRNFISNTTAIYGFDRWAQAFSGGTSVTNSAQVFTPGTAPVAGYEGKNYNRQVTVGQSAAGDYAQIIQRIESVRTLANQTATISFWAKAGSGTPKIAVELQQNFGTGGSPSATIYTYAGQVTLSTSWARYSVTVAVPSISGTTIGTNNDDMLILALWTSGGTTYNARTGSMGVQNNTFDFWGVQVEAGSVATPFQTATGTLQGELAACQRYYYRISGGTAYNAFGVGQGKSTTVAGLVIPFPVTMRTDVTTLDYSLVAVSDGAGLSNASSAVINTGQTGKNSSYVEFTSSGLTQYRPYVGLFQNNSAGYIGFSAEL